VRDTVIPNLAPARGGFGERLTGRVAFAAGLAKEGVQATLKFGQGHIAGYLQYLRSAFQS
jgi:hypothetical protein